MAKRAKLTNDKLAPKLDTKILLQLGKVLSFIGKPFYYIFSFIILIILYVVYITGHLTTELFRNLKTFPLSSNLKNIDKYLSKIRHRVIKITKTNFKYILRKISTKVYIKPKQIYPRGIYLIRIKVADFKEFFQETKIYNFSVNFPNKLSNAKIVLLKFALSTLKLGNLIRRLKFPKIRLKYFLLFSFLTLIITIPILLLSVIFKDLPSPQDLVYRNVEVSTKIYDRNKILLYKIYKNKNRTPVPLEEIPLYVRQASIAIEDAEFYSHPGFSIKGIVRAIVKNLTKGELSGGSTITQQLVKNALLTSEKTLPRKIKEIVLSIRVEMTFTKDKILEMYLNEVSYGGTAYGIQEASELYFQKPVSKLTLSEAALLAGLPKSPTKYSPFGPNPDQALARRNDVLNLMYANGFITKSQKDEALTNTIEFAANKVEVKAPHFVMFTRQILDENYGNEVVEKGGLEVVTTLDYDIQKLAEEAVKNEIEKLKSLNVTNGAVVVLNPQTGEVLAMVGSKDYFDIDSAGNVNVVTSPRQPGSSIKIVNYAYALSQGYTPATIISDAPTSFNVPGQPTYTPTNYDGKFRGNITLRSALAESRNIPAVRVLASYGVQNMIEMGEKMGITSWNDPSRYGLSLTLGGGEVKLIDLANAYATIANYGKKPIINPLINVTNYQGKNLFQNPCLSSLKGDNEIQDNLDVYAKENVCNQEQVVDPRVAFLITDILKDNSARAPAFGSFSQLVIPGHNEIAVKTGTSNNLRDNLTIGYNQKYLVAVWVGNNDNSPMSRIASGVTGASPIFNKIMSALVSIEGNHDWEVPSGIEQIPICVTTGTLTCDGCPNIKTEWFLTENKPTQMCSPSYFQDKPYDDQKTPEPTNFVEVINVGEETEKNFSIRKKPKKTLTY